MKVMVAPNENPKLEALNYPCHIQFIPKLKRDITFMLGFMVEYYYDEKNCKYYYFDCMPYDNWMEKKCKLVFENRITILRQVLSEIANYSEDIDLPTTKVDNPAQIVEIYKKCLTDGYEGVRILDENGYYCFGEAQDGQFWELRPRKVTIE